MHGNAESNSEPYRIIGNGYFWQNAEKRLTTVFETDIEKLRFFPQTLRQGPDQLTLRRQCPPLNVYVIRVCVLQLRHADDKYARYLFIERYYYSPYNKGEIIIIMTRERLKLCNAFRTRCNIIPIPLISFRSSVKRENAISANVYGREKHTQRQYRTHDNLAV